MAEDYTSAAVDDPTSSSSAGDPPKNSGTAAKSKQRRSGVVARMWRGIFGGRSDDYEKRLSYLSKEEASVHARMKRRASRSRRTARNIIVLSFFVEVIAVTYAIMTTRSLDLEWKMRALRVLPMFALPIISILVYSALTNLTRMFERKDQKTLERLRAERKAKIDELKERTNYYTTQQLIQKYDLDPAAKAAAATVLASKLGADSGLKVFLGDDSTVASSMSTGKSNDMEIVQSKGLRNRKPSHTRSHSTGTLQQFVDDPSIRYNTKEHEAALQNQEFVEHYKGPNPNEGGWLARIAALLVGEDPSQCYALICGNCHMHNGLARKEDFPYITYYCPHCNALNGSHQADENALDSSSGKETPGTSGDSTVFSNVSSVLGTPISSKSSPLHGLPEAVEEISGM
ncbi:hypothetical protein IEQ34_001008 [Dendrobium chrysotoxum]|uniref:Lunapark zinc ribbon domain-containing protein n=1 Tax=Dendrobium chrysotoxum TaxID=161865 RepID=A0AAV7HMT8_DENCH|nr:hypothetical protein IEQ34_001008 [Dendrobium chrysotoxum]